MRRPLEKPMGRNGVDEQADGRRYANAVEVAAAGFAPTP